MLSVNLFVQLFLSNVFWGNCATFPLKMRFARTVIVLKALKPGKISVFWLELTVLPFPRVILVSFFWLLAHFLFPMLPEVQGVRLPHTTPDDKK
jgi:hypothetical protein